MKILIANDDGIRSRGIVDLARWARRLGKVTICAPKTEQSGKSHAINISTPFEIKKVDFPVDVKAAYSVDSTPADCIRFGMLSAGEEFDLVLSGINRGYNLGRDIVYSGTVGAIFEAAYFDKPALAFSTSAKAFAEDRSGPVVSEEQLDRVWEYIGSEKLLERSQGLLNINFPSPERMSNAECAISLTRQGGPFYRDIFEQQEDGLYIARGVYVYENRHDGSIDADVVHDGGISVTPLTVDRSFKLG